MPEADVAHLLDFYVEWRGRKPQSVDCEMTGHRTLVVFLHDRVV